MSALEYIPRPTYLNKVIPFIDKPLIKVFTGQRRSGKSYLLRQTRDHIARMFPEGDLIFINKELPEFAAISNDAELWEFIGSRKQEGKRAFVFIDEIQEIAEFEKTLRGLLATGEYDIYCTGSNATLLSGELATMLSGRYVEIQVHTLSYTEFLEFHRLENSGITLAKYMKQGGMPFLIHLDDDDLVRQEYLRNILNTILFRDVVQRFNVRNFSFLNNLMVFLADNMGSLLSANRISEYIKSQRLSVSANTILDYLHFLESSYLVHKVKRYDITGRKIFEINDKYFFEDLGLRYALKPYDTGEVNKYMENLVFKHLLVKGYQLYVGKLGESEIDFVGKKGDQVIYVQVALTVSGESVFRREFGNLLAIRDNHPKFVITLDDYASGNHEGIIHLNLKDFLIRDF